MLLALQKLDNTDLVINAGTCGGFKRKGAEIGDVFLTEASANHDRRIPIPGFTEYGIGTIASTSILNLAESIGAKTGICTTGNSLDMTVDDAVHILSNDASVKDMESAAIAWSCALYKTPHFGLKVVTDIVDGDKPTQDEFMENLHSASVSLQQVSASKFILDDHLILCPNLLIIFPIFSACFCCCCERRYQKLSITFVEKDMTSCNYVIYLTSGMFVCARGD